MAGIPEALFDGQQFVDAYRILWVYSQASNSWERIGQVETIPVADGTNIGYLPKNFKYLLDSIPEHGGGFALITKPLLAKRSLSNPDGIIFGDITLVSNSLKIDCVQADGSIIDNSTCKAPLLEYSHQPPGFDINFSDALLDTLCLEIPGGPGPAGPDGIQGLPGVDGTSDGPIGLKGLSGKDATESYKLTGVQIIDVDDIFQTAVVKLELDAPAGILYVSKGAVALPDDADVSANKLIISQISRGISLGDCWDYTLVKIPCNANDDFDILDPMIAFYPENFDPNALDGTTKEYSLIRGRLSQLIDQIISSYQVQLENASTAYDKTISDFMLAEDAAARKVLDSLGDRLAECENITYLEYCIGINGECNMPPPTNTNPTTDALCNSLVELTCPSTGWAAPDTTCKMILTNLTVMASQNPVFAMLGGPPAQLQNAYALYPKQQLTYNNISPVFPPGTYALIYQSGAFIQQLRPDKEGGFNAQYMINGAFQKYWVGDEVNNNGGSTFPVTYASWVPGSPYGHFVNVNPGPNFPLLNTSVGVQIGMVPVSSGYIDLLGPGGALSDYFDQHAFNVTYETNCAYPCTPPVEANAWLPNPRNDFNGLPATLIQMENLIHWSSFPTITGSHTDAASLQSAYTNATIQKKSVILLATEPVYFFIRVRVAFCPTNMDGWLNMPPVIPAGGPVLYAYSNNRISFHAATANPGNTIAFINAEPFADGQVVFNLYQVTCGTSGSSTGA